MILAWSGSSAAKRIKPFEIQTNRKIAQWTWRTCKSVKETKWKRRTWKICFNENRALLSSRPDELRSFSVWRKRARIRGESYFKRINFCSKFRPELLVSLKIDRWPPTGVYPDHDNLQWLRIPGIEQLALSWQSSPDYPELLLGVISYSNHQTLAKVKGDWTGLISSSERRCFTGCFISGSGLPSRKLFRAPRVCWKMDLI